MKNKLFGIGLAYIVTLSSCSFFGPQQKDKPQFRKTASTDFSDFWNKITSRGENYNFENVETPTVFSNNEAKKIASADLKLNKGKVIFDNDEAFNEKLRLISLAKESIRMVYFIYSNDDSSSKLNQLLIEKAQSGVEVKLLVDFITNAKNMDFFSMLKNKGGKNMHISFYNVPNKQIIYDMNYMTLPCTKVANPSADSCHSEKLQKMSQLKNPYLPTEATRVMLTGLYTKNPAAVKLALGLGAQINPEDYKSQSEMSKEDKAKLIELLQIAGKALVFNSLSDRIKLHFAMMSQGVLVNPILNEMTGRLPLIKTEGNNKHENFWDYLTDYTHHKLLLVDETKFVLGGRNIEDSYHMESHVAKELAPGEKAKEKYIFFDTDFSGAIENASGKKEMTESYDRLFNFSEMVQSIEKVKAFGHFDLVANSTGKITQEEAGATELAYGYCNQTKNLSLECVLNALSKMPNFLSEDKRVDVLELVMNKNANERFSTYKSVRTIPSLEMNQEELNKASFYYLENLSFNPFNPKVRHFGSKMFNEAVYSKNIQAAWVKGLENICRISREKDQIQDVVFHTAYLFFHTGVVTRISKMMSGDYGDCSRVRISFITNSVQTTDLAPVNVLAQYQMAALITYYKELENYENNYNKGGLSKYKRFFPSLNYYEYNIDKFEKQSLHSKVTVIGDDLIIGSANGDLRSYAMDTNNAIMIRNAHGLVSQYKNFVYSLVKKDIIVEKSNEMYKSLEDFSKQNKVFLYAGAEKWNKTEKLTPELAEDILSSLDKVGLHIYNVTNELIYHRESFTTMKNDPELGTQVFQKSKELNSRANELDRWYKVF